MQPFSGLSLLRRGLMGAAGLGTAVAQPGAEGLL